MSVYEKLTLLRDKARADDVLRRKILATADGKNSLTNLCAIARENGIEVYPMDVIAWTEDYHAAMKRSTNGGGENSPMISGWDRFYDMFIMELKK